MMHNLIKVKNYLLVIDDSEIRGADWVYVEKYPEAPWQFMKPPCPIPYWGNKEETKKIIAHLPLNNAPYLDGVDVLPPIEDDVEILIPFPNGNGYRDGKEIGVWMKGWEEGYKEGYNKSREKYKWSDEDVIKIVEKSRKTGLTAEFLMLSMQQPKYPIAFECEIEPEYKYIGAVKEVKGSGNKIKNKNTGKPKTFANSEGRTEWVGKCLYE